MNGENHLHYVMRSVQLWGIKWTGQAQRVTHKKPPLNGLPDVPPPPLNSSARHPSVEEKDVGSVVVAPGVVVFGKYFVEPLI